MTKRHADSMADVSPTDPNHPWVTRGYRPDFAYSVRKEPIEDPYGEIAYQRAFFAAAEAKSRRVPDPVIYINSPSAQDYIRRSHEAICSVRPRAAYNKSSTQPNTPSSTGTPNYSPGKPSPSHSVNGLVTSRPTDMKSEYELVPAFFHSSPNNRTSQQASAKFARPLAGPYRNDAPNGLPLTIEPKLDALLGPSRMLK